jgi:outer membrane protein assembly factor BamB
MYFPLQNGCSNVTAVSERQSLDSLYGITFRGVPAPGPANEIGTVTAISAETGAVTWRYTQQVPTTAVISTGGGLIFGGDNGGRFRALDQATGRMLWEVNLGSPVSGFPITYAVGGKQYVAVSVGGGLGGGGRGGRGAAVSNNIFVFALPN